MTAALPALLLEAVFYLAAGFPETREWFANLGPLRAQASLLWISALAPYLLFSFAAGTFERHAFYLLAALTAVLAFWHAVLPRRFAYDAGFLVIAGAPVLLHVFERIYRSPGERLPVETLGHLMWIRTGVIALLVLRQWNPGAFSFWPRRQEWKAGLLYYAVAVIPLIALALALHDVRWEPGWRKAALGIGTFFGMLWVVAFSEELFFRGLIERAILNTWRSPAAAIGASAVLYGAAHLPYHGFPNWQHALVVTLLGIACGTAYWRTGSVRVPMVTHALVATTWRVLFK